jgi:hypothetical protein
MNIKEQIEKAKDKNRLYSDLVFNLRLFLENIPQIMNPLREITLEFKELSQEMSLIRRQLITQLEELESFLPVFPIEGEIMRDV